MQKYPSRNCQMAPRKIDSILYSHFGNMFLGEDLNLVPGNTKPESVRTKV